MLELAGACYDDGLVAESKESTDEARRFAGTFRLRSAGRSYVRTRTRRLFVSTLLMSATAGTEVLGCRSALRSVERAWKLAQARGRALELDFWRGSGSSCLHSRRIGEV